MAAAPAAWAVLGDILWCLGLGCLLGAGRDALGLLLGEGPVRRFCWDLLAFAAAAVLVCGFSAGVSASGLARWYMTAGMLAGALAWHHTMRPAARRILAALFRILTWPVRWVQGAVLEPCRRRLGAWLRRHLPRPADKKVGKKPKSGKKQLQKPSKILYN